MLSRSQRDAVLAGIPDELGGTSVTKYRDGHYGSLPSFPCLVIRGPQTSSRARYNGTLVKTVWNAEDEVYDEVNAVNQFTTVRVDVEALTEDEATDLARALVETVYSTKLGLDWFTDRVKLSSIPNPGLMLSYQHAIQGGSGHKKIYQMVVEIRVEYELGWDVVGAPMKEFETSIEVGDSEETIDGSIEYELPEES